MPDKSEIIIYVVIFFVAGVAGIIGPTKQHRKNKELEAGFLESHLPEKKAVALFENNSGPNQLFQKFKLVWQPALTQKLYACRQTNRSGSINFILNQRKEMDKWSRNNVTQEKME